MYPGDVLVGIVGTIGSVGLVTKGQGKLTGNCKLAIVRPNALPSEYVAIFLASCVGQNEIKRRIHGTVQMGLILPDLKKIPIALPTPYNQSRITDRVQEAYDKRNQANRLYDEAGKAFLENFGLENIYLQQQLFYEDFYQNTTRSNRIDAEFYQPKYKQALDILEKTRTHDIVPLGHFLEIITNGHTPLYHDLTEGEILFLTAEHILDFQINYETEKRINKEQYEGELKRTRLSKGDMLVTIKGRVGNAAIVEELPQSVNINQDIALLRLNKNIPSYYLLAFLNSSIGKTFVDQFWVAPHLTVVWFACNENEGPDILLLVRSPTRLGGHKHGPHNDILPQYGVPRQRTNRPGQHWHPLVQGQALYLHGVPQDVQRHERHGLLSPADLCGDGEPGGDAPGPRVSTPSDRRRVWL